MVVDYEHNRPDFDHVNGQIVETGAPELAVQFHKHGYDRLRTLDAML